MALEKCNKKNFSVFSIIFVILVSSLFLFSINYNQNVNSSLNNKNEGSEFIEFKNPQLAATENLTAIWYENPTFDDPIEPTWYSNLEGDQSDINATSGAGQVNYEILGETHTFSEISGTPNSSTSPNWYRFNNPEFPADPDNDYIDGEGCYADHYWYEEGDQAPSVHWEKNVTMPLNMSDYIITSASLSAEVNATVTAYPGSVNSVPQGYGVEVYGDDTGPYQDDNNQFFTGDYIRFYVLLSDLSKTKVYEAAYNQTVDLGKDSAGAYDNMTDTLMTPVSEENLIFFLTSVLSSDYHNFTITLGIRIWCEDNWYSDRDRWDEIYIKSCSLSFTYEKKIDQFSTISWGQDGDKITRITNDTIVTVKEAKLNFKYKINEDWTALSPNSEFRIYINNNKLSETVKLSSANSDFQLANKLGGFNVSDIITYDVKINLSIHVYLADEFHLGSKKIISIDDVYLNITYTVEFPDYQTDIEVYFNGINKTDNPIFQISAKTDLNITIKYPDNMSLHIPQAVVQLTGNLTASLQENELLGQYTIILNTEDLPIGEIYFNMIAHRINYEAQKRSGLLIVSKITTENIQIFLDGEEKTSFPFVDVPLHKLLNITVKYKDTTGDHVPGATVQLVGDGIFENLDENSEFEQYSVILNTTLKFRLGLNDLLVNAQKDRYQEKSINPRITVRKINTQITPTSGSNNINIRPGQNANISIFINDTDFNKIIRGAIVTYKWEFGEGVLTDEDNDGIYQEIFENVPTGTHSVNISAFGSDIYNFESYEIIINALRPKQNLLLFQILLTLGIIVSVAIGGYLYAYQKILKYPRQVRKVRKYRKTLNKRNAPNVGIKDREKAFGSKYKEETKDSSKFMTGKPTIKKSEEHGAPEKKTEKPKINTGSKNKINSETKINNKDLNNQKSYNKRNLIKVRKLRFGVLKLKKFRQFISILIIAVLLVNFFIVSQYFNQNSDNLFYSRKDDYQGDLGVSGQEIYTKQWLNDTSFDNLTEPVWFASYGDLGDKSDVAAMLDDNHYANLTVIGDNGTFSDILGTPNSTSSLGWINVTNPAFPAPPDFQEIDEYGCEINHLWIDPADPVQSPSAHWENNITMPINMSDYIITSASVSAEFNASVATLSGSGDPNYGIESRNDSLTLSGDYSRDYDKARFYVLISDLEDNEVHEIAWYQTVDLGQDLVSPEIASIPDTLMNTIVEEALIFYLTSLFERDNLHFKITLGIRIQCIDNYQFDRDEWISLRIKSCNLTFNYEKRIDQFTSVSWNQDADKLGDISPEIVVLNEAILNFKYKIDQNWTESSPNSELKILINNNPHTETVKLSTANESFQEGKIDGFDVTPLITDDINVSIQLFLADEFKLDRNITISIDDVELNITYTIIFPPQESALQLFLNNENRTFDTNFELFIEDQLNITIKYLNKTGAHIPNATVSLSGNFTGTLTENETLEQYSIIIDTEISDLGVNFLTIIAYAEDYDVQKIYPIITIKKFISQDLQVFLNNENMTLDPEIELNLDEELNITVKYSDSVGTYIPNASIRLISEGITKDLNESSIFQHYTTIINTSDRLRIGLNYLSIEAQHLIYQTKYSIIKLYVRKFNVDISTISGSNRIELDAGNDVNIRINLNNTDIDELLKGAIVTYVWEQGDGILTDPDNDGIYEGTIENVPEGAFTIKISAFAGDDYEIQDYELTIVAVGESQVDAILVQTLFILSVIITIGLSIYLYAYQTYLKYPRQVRKVRKYRKSLKRESAPSVHIIGRKIAFQSLYNANLGKLLRLKRHPTKDPSLDQKSTLDKVKKEELSPKLESEELIDKSLEKKEELDKIVGKSLDENTKPT